MRERKSSLLIIYLCLILLCCGCQPNKCTYTKEKAVESIISLCQKEYSLKPNAWLEGETVWVYLPLPHLVTKDIQWDKDMLEKVNKVIMGASRVLLSMKPRPVFMAIVASDIEQVGLDYIITVYITDIVKYQLQAISRDEFLRRHVMKIEQSNKIIADTEGEHIEKKEIRMQDFITRQIEQRIQWKFIQDEKFKDYFDVLKVDIRLDNDSFKIYVDIRQKRNYPEGPIDIQKEIAKIVAYTVQVYEFDNFLSVEIENRGTGVKSVLSKLDLRRLS